MITHLEKPWTRHLLLNNPIKYSDIIHALGILDIGYPNSRPSQSILNTSYYSSYFHQPIFTLILYYSCKILIFSTNFLFWRRNTISLLKLVQVAVYKLLICVRYLWKKYVGTKNENFWNLVGQNEHKYIRYIEIFQTYSFYLLSPYSCCILLFCENCLLIVNIL